jgi:hypothetical protein
VIVVLGRPRVRRRGPDGPLVPAGLATEIALALGRVGAEVELVGSLGDDPEGDQVVVELGRAGVGHAALLRDPATRTPPAGREITARPLPRLEAADVELGLRYLSDCRVLVVAEPLDPAALGQALAAAAYHGADAVVVAPPGSVDPASLGEGVTLLERPAAGEVDPEPEAGLAGGGDGSPDIGGDGPPEDGAADMSGDEAPEDGPADEATFAGFVAAYSLGLERGASAEDALMAALDGGGWERSPG